MSNSKRNSEGFTLVEIAVAVAILGIAMVTLVGLHTRMLDTYFNERNRLQASLYARYLMTMIEVEPTTPDPGSEQEDLYSALEEAGYFGGDGFEKPDESLRDWTYLRQIEQIDLPLAANELAEDALRRIDLVIQWGPSDDQQFGLVYFVNPASETVGGGIAPGAASNRAPGGQPQGAGNPFTGGR